MLIKVWVEVGGRRNRGLQFARNPLSSNGVEWIQFAAKPLIANESDTTLNQRVPGSSPGAPTIHSLSNRGFPVSGKALELSDATTIQLGDSVAITGTTKVLETASAYFGREIT
jgi:hypothetical protein